MSKKQLFNRLDNFFANINHAEETTPTIRPEIDQGWSWKCDHLGIITACDENVLTHLKLNADSFIGKSIFDFQISSDSSLKIQAALQGNQFPIEISIDLITGSGEVLSVTSHIFKTSNSNELLSWYIINQPIIKIEDQNNILKNNPPTSAQRSIPAFTKDGKSGSYPGKLPKKDDLTHSEKRTSKKNQQIKISKPSISTELNNQSKITLNSSIGTENLPSMTVPFKIGESSSGLLEIVEEKDNQRRWTEDEKLLVEEVANQLALALENVQLYTVVQQELSERIKVEQEIKKRNLDLATLNKIGQELSSLTTRGEIYNFLKTSIGRLIITNNLIVAIYDSEKENIHFPLYMIDAEEITIADREIGNQILDYIILSKKPLLISQSMKESLYEKRIEIPNPVPKSVLGIPMISGDKVTGCILLQDFEKENAYSTVHLELLSTMGSQVTTALANADLFEDIRSALFAIEKRENYQVNIARAIAMLSESGTVSIPYVLELLSQAAKNNFTYFAQIREDSTGHYWQNTSEWEDPIYADQLEKSTSNHIQVSNFSNWVNALNENGWVTLPAPEMSSAEIEFLNSQNLSSTLLLSVPGKSSIPAFIAFNQIDHKRVWESDEISLLRVAADAVSNTIVREDLLDQLQVSLDETESMYSASHELALANDLEEMIKAISLGLQSQTINRGLVIQFDFDKNAKPTAMRVTANWHSGKGTPPLPIGSQFQINDYAQIFLSENAAFYDDLIKLHTKPLLKNFAQEQNIHSMAILPMWVGKRQIGVLLLQSDDRHHFTAREMRSYPPLVGQMAIAVENFHLFESTQKALAETEELYKISTEIAQSKDAQDLVEAIANNVMPAEAKRISILFIEEDSEGHQISLHIAGQYDKDGLKSNLGLHIPTAKLPAIKIVRNESISFSDISSSDLDLTSKTTLLDMKIHAGILVPLRSAGKLIGLLTATSDKAATFKPEEIRILEVTGSGVSVALERQVLLNEAQRRAVQLQAAAEIARDTTSTLSFDTLLSRIINQLTERFNFYHTSIFLLDEKKNFAIVRESSGSIGQLMKNQKHKLAVGSRSVIGTVTLNGTPLLVSDVHKSANFYANPLLPETQSEIGLPLKLGNRIIGALDIQSQKINAFTSDDLAVFQILADQIAVAIDNAQSYELAQKAVQEMKEVDRLKSQFLANMSHELRTPLNSIIGFSRVIIKGIDGPINEIQNQDLTAIYNSGQHLLNLINDILDLSKIEAGKMDLSFSDININDLITSVMSTAVGLVKDKPIKLDYKIEDDLPIIHADATRVRQVLLNFLSNAAKFTDEGSITIAAEITKDHHSNPEIMVTVTDTGPGIAPEDKTKLFLPFSQVDDSPTRKTGGSGLGLSICRSFIEMHKGRIGLLESQVGKGSTFYFTLPIHNKDNRLSVNGENKNKNYVLSIDDDPKVINLYERYLSNKGYGVIPLTNPAKAVAKAKEIKPFAITLDIMMPEKDGWEVIRELKNDPETANIPVIICSILEEEEKGFSLGASEYLVKPFMQEDLIAAVNRVNSNGMIRNILVIDDDPADLRLVQKILDENSNYKVHLSLGGQEGWQTILEIHPDAVILDLFMPNMNGFEILENMRMNKLLQNIPVIILTGADLSSTQYKQLAEFGKNFLTKGFLKENDLINALDSVLEHKLSNQG